MSILPSEAQIQVPNSSSDSHSQNPNFNHGTNLVQLSPPSPNQIPGSSDSTAQYSSGSSKEVSELGSSNGRRSVSHQNSGRQFRNHNHSRGRGAGSAQFRGKISGASVSPGIPQYAGSANSQGNTGHSAGRRAQMISGNHLLNFQYDPISRPQYRTPPPPARRQRKLKPYNKDLFLQANYKFVVLDTGDYAPELMDPDKMLQWEDIICVRYSTPFPVQCPICLEYPLCPQITSCGHIFCFPCILQYLLMGHEDCKGDSFKRCPLCFVVISSKELYTIHIENVKQYSVGDTIEFMLLTREKDSFVPSQKSKKDSRALAGSVEETYDAFSKFTFTSDVDLSVRKAMSDLDGWLAKADSGLVDDLEQLPYVCAAMEQLEQRKKYWNKHRARGTDKASNDAHSQTGFSGPQSAENASDPGLGLTTSSTDFSQQFKKLAKLTLNNSDSNPGQNSALGELSDCDETSLSSSYDESRSLQANLTGSTDITDKDSYNFYQAIDGQHLILHPLNMKCLLHHYESSDKLPHRISGRILQLESVTQSEAIRRRFRFLSHFSLTTTFQLCEIDLNETLPLDALSPFIDEIRKREQQRKQLANKERKEKMKAEAALVHSMPILPSFGHSYNDSPTFSIDDFEALGSSPVISSSPPNVGERRLFSSVTRLGFAAGHDSPSLKIEETNVLSNNEQLDGSSGVSGSRNSGTPSFAHVMSRDKSGESLEALKVTEVGKKGKKPSRVLLSTSGGRRY